MAALSSVAESLRVDQLLAALGPAFLGSLIPALVWLAFWVREDSDHPEPRRAVITTFFLGAAAIPGVMVVQLVASRLFLGGADVYLAAQWAPAAALVTVIVWVIVEEGAKLVGAYAGGLSKRELDEPIDASIYLIAAALGFSAAENFFYVLKEVYNVEGQVAVAVMASSTRAIGATTLHVAAAAVLGVFGGYAHFATPRAKRAIWASGFVLVVALHLAFNALIIFGGTDRANAAALGISWLVSLAAIVALEKLKAMRVEAGRPPKQPKHG
jgi:RsiW-degrading membrane proteinase PrsW (M82 family)